MTDISIEPFDAKAAPEELFRARYELGTVLQREAAPEDPMEPYERWRDSWNHVPSWRTPHHWTVVDPSGGVVAVASMPLDYVETNRNLAWFDIQVHPDARRQGIGTRLLAPIVEVAEADARTILGAGTIEGAPGEAFLRRFGAELKATERKSRLEIDELDLNMMREWVKRAEERASAYRLVDWQNRCPDAYLERFIALYDATNTAPRDNLEMEDHVHTPERHRENEERSLAQGGTSWTLAAEKADTGELAGFTELYFSTDNEDIVWQGWTAVDTAHRNLGIGRWVKAAMALRLVDARPEIRHVDTWNAFSNEPMLNINIAMGFKLVRGYSDWQVPTATLAANLRQ
jgi:GNAT superfamily N-acetyltransferase